MSLSVDITSLVRYRAAASTLWLVLLLTWESLAPAVHAFRSQGDRGRHALRNLLLGGINAALTGLVFVALWSRTSEWAANNGIGLLHLVSLPAAVRWCAAILLFDLWTYLWHRAGHRLPHLWDFHRVHHSDASMDVTTANRFHAAEILLSSVLRIPLIALLGLRMPEIVLYETLLQFVVQFQHANIRLPAPMEALLRLVVVTPGLHRVHHSRWQPETDSNFSSLLTVWDRAFGTFRVRDDDTAIRLGLDGFDDERLQRFAGLWSMPFLRPGSRTPDEAAGSRAPEPPSG